MLHIMNQSLIASLISFKEQN